LQQRIEIVEMSRLGDNNQEGVPNKSGHDLINLTMDEKND